ncbi:hypothetical protein HBI56_188850 [Parastagonospora nodorum]|uniref:Uncharacterized protein n=1 Tax=Phaeosphaeria nodorum (strain SN15 / ATCC MYA-4574 / FGSC 10173) TaxID=321614 RepID=A0A7U2F9Q1_PHANO|nr:hypothetical protein HBH56_145630 [Parastagonospora nodorum]QRD01313.1 hypothetical protein JI435_308180 [Parastagonospora nodorum SN15]KAH3927739.1 hypothetical protein HBH54_150820 [Parastagonospora nodorum]KAH3948036.1 hypothetical protein HBH53_110840 [Parastagonospora nodorum]KAH3960110.1 hypothetical protein HBH51_194680 [Parastagonospora nodorum]
MHSPEPIVFFRSVQVRTHQKLPSKLFHAVHALSYRPHWRNHLRNLQRQRQTFLRRSNFVDPNDFSVVAKSVGRSFTSLSAAPPRCARPHYSNRQVGAKVWIVELQEGQRGIEGHRGAEAGWFGGAVEGHDQSRL